MNHFGDCGVKAAVTGNQCGSFFLLVLAGGGTTGRLGGWLGQQLSAELEQWHHCWGCPSPLQQARAVPPPDLGAPCHPWSLTSYGALSAGDWGVLSGSNRWPQLPASLGIISLRVTPAAHRHLPASPISPKVHPTSKGHRVLGAPNHLTICLCSSVIGKVWAGLALLWVVAGLPSGTCLDFANCAAAETDGEMESLRHWPPHGNLGRQGCMCGP